MDHFLTLPLGLPGQGMHLGLDPLAALFLCLLAPQVMAGAMGALRRSLALWVFVAGMALTVLAADGFALILGFGVMSAAHWLLLLRRDRRLPDIAVMGFSNVCLIAVVFMTGDAAFLLLLAATGATALAPSDVGPQPAAPVLAAGSRLVSLYVLVRYGFVVFGAASAAWWGAVLSVAGAAMLLSGGRRAVLQAEMKPILAGVATAQLGLVAIGLGIALWAKAVADPALAALALQAALLWAVAQALLGPLLFLGVDAVFRATGTTSLDRLGGMMRGMPRLGLLVLAGAAGVAALPLGPGFAAQFSLLHAVLAAVAFAAPGSVVAHFGLTVLLVVLGLGAGLLSAAAIRLVGVGFLGRPRSLRAAAAEEADRPTLMGMAVLALLCVVPALLPGLLLAVLQPVLALLAPGAPALPLPYAPLPLALLILAAAGVAWLGLRRFGTRGEMESRPWNGGFGRPPTWLPFGDPMTQPSGTGFSAPLREMLTLSPPANIRLLMEPLRHAAPWRRFVRPVRRAITGPHLGIAFAVLVGFLLALGLGSTSFGRAI